MISEKQLEANRRNAQYSTGPRTEQGKAAVSWNAFKHGRRSERLRDCAPDPEDRDQFDDLCAQLRDEYQPQTPTEVMYVDRIAVCQLKLVCLETPATQSGRQQSRGVNLDEADLRMAARLEHAIDNAVKMLRLFRADRSQHPPRPAQQLAAPPLSVIPNLPAAPAIAPLARKSRK